MPRQLSIVETAKQRSLRVPLDYYRRNDRLRQAKLLLSAAAAGLAAVYVAWLALGGGPARRQLSPGPVASVHASWNDDCCACHQDFRPLRSDSFDWRGLLTGAVGTHGRGDLTCVKCHNEPDHHATAIANEVPGCAACHQDHRGTAADIRRAADFQCLTCHRDLPNHRRGPSGHSPAIANVTAFATSPDSAPSHPDFRSLTSDPGNIKFNHWLHLQPGIAPADAKQKLKAADAAAAYRGSADRAGLVQLDCAACHEPESDGRLMRPIAYEQHCAACHPVNVAVGERAVSVPHGLTAARLSEAIDGLLFQAERNRQAEADPSAASDESGAQPLIPGRTLGKNLAQKIGADVLGQRRSIVAVVQAKCTQCHYALGSEDGAVAESVNLRPANVPNRWLTHARFDHAAHRHTECRTCHQAAYEFEQHDKSRFVAASANSIVGGGVARDDEQVMIAGIESCVNCHAPRRGDAGGARHDCAECHEYHGPNKHGRSSQANAGGDFQVRFASLTKLQPASRAAEPRSVSSCAASGCHGAEVGEGPAWRSAFTNWSASDPHLQAYEVLWTARGRGMTQSLEQRGAGRSDTLLADTALSDTVLSDTAHAAVLEQRCSGCHSSSATQHALGVSCESCHGPAEGWEHTHYRSGFSRGAGSGFVDTKNLSQRAAVCLPCHVGPSAAGGQVVDHDLIAAGHPRLAFEFRSFLESLPAHWDRRGDEQRRTGEHHFQSWVAGQAAQATAFERLDRNSNPPDFARLECSRCHHALAHGAWRQARSGTGLLDPQGAAPEWKSFAGRAGVPAAERLRMLAALARRTANSPTWDSTAAAYLAGLAVSQDLAGGAVETEFRERVAELGAYLGKDCFAAVSSAGREATIYDSPSDFDPAIASTKLAALAAAVERAAEP